MLRFVVISLIVCGLIGLSSAASIDVDSIEAGNTLVVPRGFTRKEYLKSIVDFWTPERMASATPLHPTLDATPDADLSARVQSFQPKQILSRSVPEPGSRLKVPNAVGRAFFVFDGLTYVCSGSVVTAANRDLVVTAGHCVYNTTSKKYASNWVFVPQYDTNVRPVGTFVWRFMKASSVWEQKVDYNQDVAIVLMNHDENGIHIQEKTGSFGLTINGEKKTKVNAFGYPMNMNNGETVSTCEDNSVVANLLLMGNFKGLQIGCEMGGGASGGPWLENYKESDHSGQQVSLTSFSYIFAPKKIHGPHFASDNIGTLFNAYQNA